MKQTTAAATHDALIRQSVEDHLDVYRNAAEGSKRHLIDAQHAEHPNEHLIRLWTYEHTRWQAMVEAVESIIGSVADFEAGR